MHASRQCIFCTDGVLQRNFVKKKRKKPPSVDCLWQVRSTMLALSVFRFPGRPGVLSERVQRVQRVHWQLRLVAPLVVASQSRLPCLADTEVKLITGTGQLYPFFVCCGLWCDGRHCLARGGQAWLASGVRPLLSALQAGAVKPQPGRLQRTPSFPPCTLEHNLRRGEIAFAPERFVFGRCRSQ